MRSIYIVLSYEHFMSAATNSEVFLSTGISSGLLLYYLGRNRGDLCIVVNAINEQIL